MHKTICTIHVDEGAEVSEAGNPTGIDLALLKLIQHAFFERLAGFGAGSALRKNKTTAFAIHFNDANSNGLPHHFLPALFRSIASSLGPAQGTDLRGRHKAT